MKKSILYSFGFIGILTLVSCDKTGDPQVSNSVNTNSNIDGTSFFGLLTMIDLDLLHPENYTVDDLLNKYQLVLSDFSDYKYAKAARGQLIMLLVDKMENIPDDQVTYLVEEIDKFDMAYPKQNYLLLEEAQKRGKMTLTEILQYGQKAHNKALAKAYIWQSEVNKPQNTSSENSYTADVSKKNLDRALYTEKLKKYGSNQD